MKYDTYQLLIDDMERLYHKIQKRDRIKHARSHKDALRAVLMEEKSLLHSLDLLIMVEEWNWLFNTDRNVIFPESTTVLEKLLQSKVSIANPEPVVMPHSSFILAVPRGFSYGGHSIPPIIVTQLSAIERDKLIADFGRNCLGTPLHRKADDHEKTIMVNYRSEAPGVERHKGLMANRICFPQFMLPALLECSNGAEFSRKLGTFPDYNNVIPLSEEESDLQFLIVRLVAMVGLYTHSFSDRLTQGYPNSAPPKNMEPVLHRKWNSQRLSLPVESDQSNDKAYHYRSWHFRQLMDKRYYQGEHAGKPIGSRVVFVRDAMVGRDIDAETLK